MGRFVSVPTNDPDVGASVIVLEESSLVVVGGGVDDGDDVGERLDVDPVDEIKELVSAEVVGNVLEAEVDVAAQ